ncbi:hypothetical protein GW17_00018240 [Ensete ventricosum]|nr:hypothetical protein GW17_00018240 [Ensete ventricosum]
MDAWRGNRSVDITSGVLHLTIPEVEPSMIFMVDLSPNATSREPSNCWKSARGIRYADADGDDFIDDLAEFGHKCLGKQDRPLLDVPRNKKNK